MSEKTEEIYDFVIAYKSQHDGLSPSVREIGAVVGLSSTAVVDYHLSKLVKAGRLARVGSRVSRGLMVTGATWQKPNK